MDSRAVCFFVLRKALCVAYVVTLLKEWFASVVKVMHMYMYMSSIHTGTLHVFPRGKSYKRYIVPEYIDSCGPSLSLRHFQRVSLLVSNNTLH